MRGIFSNLLLGKFPRGSIFDSGLPRSLYRAASTKKARLKQAYKQMTPMQKKAFIGKVKKWLGEKFDEFMANNALDEMRSIKAGELDLFMEYKQKFENFGQELETFMMQNKQQGRAGFEVDVKSAKPQDSGKFKSVLTAQAAALEKGALKKLQELAKTEKDSSFKKMADKTKEAISDLRTLDKLQDSFAKLQNYIYNDFFKEFVYVGKTKRALRNFIVDNHKSLLKDPKSFKNQASQFFDLNQPLSKEEGKKITKISDSTLYKLGEFFFELVFFVYLPARLFESMVSSSVGLVKSIIGD